ncbi:MAG: hypothetical protein JWM98_849 [Thermoleophilia bacterium]|nr:hypothetical protein [Thermoleophilia bacterium]
MTSVAAAGAPAGAPSNLAIGVGTAVGFGVAGIASCSVMDRIIDVTAHDHSTLAYRGAGWPTRIIAGAAVTLAAAGLLARTNEHTRDLSNPLLAAAAGAGAAYGATMLVRMGWGLTVAPAQRGWVPGQAAKVSWRVDDIAANAVDRTRMMGRDPDLAKWPMFSWISKAQGHGGLAERAADFVPVLRDAA